MSTLIRHNKDLNSVFISKLFSYLDDLQISA